MGIDPELLGQGETEVLHLRNHVKALLWPAASLLGIAVVVGLAVALLPPAWVSTGWWVIALVALVAVLIWVVGPFLAWWSTTYTFTNRRIITRSGVIVKKGHDLPLSRINNIAYSRSLLDRVLGCGRLELTTAADEPVVLKDIPDVERVHVVMTELLFGAVDPIAQPHARDE